MLTTDDGEHILVQLPLCRLMLRQAQQNFCWILIGSRGISKSPEELPHVETVQVQGLTKVRCHTKIVCIWIEAPNQHYSEQVITTFTYTELRPGSSKVAVCMRN